jgi:hypothetical protein
LRVRPIATPPAATRVYNSRARAAMRARAVLLRLFLTLSLALSQTHEPITIAPPQRWPVGERFAFEMESESEVVDETGRRSSRASATRFTVECTEHLKDEVVCRWTRGATRALGAAKQADALTLRALAPTEGLAYDVHTRADGAPIALVDATVVRAKLAELVAAVRKDVAAAGERASELGETLDVGVKALEGDGLESALLREPARFFAANGLRLEAGKPLESAGEFPNPFGGDLLPSTRSWTLVAHDEAKHAAKLEWRETVDAALATSVTREAIARSMTEKQRRELGDDEFLRLPVFTRCEERGTLAFDTLRGRPTSAEFVRTLVVNGKSTVEARRFRVVPEATGR